VSLAPGSIESLSLDGPAGRLEALLNLGAANAGYTALVCHPHPLFGGTMHNKVVFHAMKALNGLGLPVLRFNFRGVGTSAGEHDHGHGEQQDVRVALDYLAKRFGKPIVFAGFSFGAAIGLRAAVPHPEVVALAALGLPVNADGREYTYGFMDHCDKPKLMLSGGQDEFATAAQLEKVFARLAEPKRLVIVPEADHFFTGHLETLRAELGDWAREITSLP
jgi:hypothetical protein